MHGSDWITGLSEKLRGDQGRHVGQKSAGFGDFLSMIGPLISLDERCEGVYPHMLHQSRRPAHGLLPFAAGNGFPSISRLCARSL